MLACFAVCLFDCCVAYVLLSGFFHFCLSLFVALPVGVCGFCLCDFVGFDLLIWFWPLAAWFFVCLCVVLIVLWFIELLWFCFD